MPWKPAAPSDLQRQVDTARLHYRAITAEAEVSGA
jgi:hypothetical protein